MQIKTIFRVVFFLSILLPALAHGQLSQGGIPIEIIKQMSAISNTDLVVMPAIDNQMMRTKYSRTDQNRLKPFQFAHSFEVSLSPNNSGNWYNTSKVNVWQLRIRSTGAYSLNLILNNFKLPDGARLFLISSGTGEIKGAYTSLNNTDSQILAIEPVSGDELLVQYEEPVHVSFPGTFLISQIGHDFIGITSSGPHRPLGISGSCNVNVNCDIANGDENLRDAVCRIIIDGKEICTGSLMNNTAKDGTPYILTAFHCYLNSNGTSTPTPTELERKAQASVFLYNYESPYCSSIDGDVSHSLSGSTMKASFDSLDFALVSLNNVPPYNYRPYMAGWNRVNLPPASSLCISHPKGDIKKVSIDNYGAYTSTYSSSLYHVNGFWKIARWDNGVTEVGSSGGPLFDQNKQIIGTLTGGDAVCGNPVNDYFEKFALSWDYRKEANKQLKYWLDPLNLNSEKLDGMYLNSGMTLCKPFTNIKDNESYQAVQILEDLIKKGYWSGTNRDGYTDFAEQYKFSKNCEVLGITLGIAKAKTNTNYTQSFVNVQVFEGKDQPQTLLYSENFDIKKFWSDGMNYLQFQNPVKTTGNFFISYNIEQLHEGDTLAVYMANRKSDVTNSFYLKNQSGWLAYNSKNLNGNGSALLTELIACNIDDPLDVEVIKPDLKEARFFPNPVKGETVLTVQTVDPIDCPEDIAVYDLLGKKQNVLLNLINSNSLSVNFSGKRPGIYFVHLESGGRTIIGKVAYLP